MALGDLNVPHEAFAWIEHAGGPRLQPGQTIERMGIVWQAVAASGCGWLATGTFVDRLQPYRSIDQRAGQNEVDWSVTLSIAKDVHARLSGKTTVFDDALATASAIDLSPIELADHLWFPDGHEAGSGWIAAVDGQALTLRHRVAHDGGEEWTWERTLPPGSAERHMAAIFCSYGMHGAAATLADAARDAIESRSLLLRLASDLVGDHQFQAGRKAGISEAQAHVQLLCADPGSGTQSQ